MKILFLTMQKIFAILVKILLGILLVAIMVVIICFIYNLIRYTGKDQCGIVGNKVSTHASCFVVPIINGSPDDYQSFEGGVAYCYQDVTLFGVEHCKVRYMGSVGVYDIRADIPVERNNRETLLEMVHQSLRNEYVQYQYQKGYYYQESTDVDGNVTSMATGCVFGALAIHAEMSLEDDIIVIKIYERF